LSRKPVRSLRAIAIVIILWFPSSIAAGGQAIAKKAAISTTSPLATNAGLAVLQRGGTAADAAVAVAFTLAVVHPQSGNLGGGGFLVYYDASTGGVWALDFRETAPRALTREAFEKIPAPARTGALLSGVPGTVAGLGALHSKFGSRPWKELIAPAAQLAREGFVVDERLASDIATALRDRDLAILPGAEIGAALALPELAATLERIASGGAREMYVGETARRLVAGIKERGGLVGHRDLRDYEPVWRAPIKLGYGAFDLYTVPPPPGGGMVIGGALNILSQDDLAATGFQTPRSLHLLLEAQRRAYIDRDRVIADPAASRIPYRDVLSPERGEQWRKTIDEGRVIGTASLTSTARPSPDGQHPTHFTITDTEGNVLSMTTSLGDEFGSGIVAARLGFLMNNALAEFGSGPDALDASRRPASSMTPVIVLREGKPYLALGTGGGRSIPSSVLQVFLNLVTWQQSLAGAIAAPRYVHTAFPDELVYEKGRAPQETIDALNAIGHGVSGRDQIGEVHAILFEDGRILAVADPRTQGAAGGF
jgi:gamma-glutamyltranspeptidase / glutathione hydrolase